MRRLLIPPRVVLTLLITSIGVGLAAPVLGPAAWPLRVVGLVLIVPSLAINISSAGRFQQIGTNIYPYLDPDVLVATGHFRWTRNPMYVGFLGLLTGAAIAVGSLTAWLGPVAYFLYSELWIIPFEEERMTARFGDDYAAYRRRVPRWIGPVRA